MKQGTTGSAWGRMRRAQEERRERDDHNAYVSLVNRIQRDNPGLSRNDAARSACVTRHGYDPHAGQPMGGPGRRNDQGLAS